MSKSFDALRRDLSRMCNDNARRNWMLVTSKEDSIGAWYANSGRGEVNDKRARWVYRISTKQKNCLGLNYLQNSPGAVLEWGIRVDYQEANIKGIKRYSGGRREEFRGSEGWRR